MLADIIHVAPKVIEIAPEPDEEFELDGISGVFERPQLDPLPFEVEQPSKTPDVDSGADRRLE